MDIKKVINDKIKAYVVNLGRGPQPDTRSHKRMFADYYAGIPMFRIAAKYKKSPQRITQIRVRYGLPTREELLGRKGVSK